jgi:hypothetical protein
MCNTEEKKFNFLTQPFDLSSDYQDPENLEVILFFCKVEGKTNRFTIYRLQYRMNL